jgi:hypothetical protein
MQDDIRKISKTGVVLQPPTGNKSLMTKEESPQSKIKKLFKTGVVLQPCTGNQTLIIKEDSPQSKIKKLFIKGVPENAVAFTLDYKTKRNQCCFEQLSCYFNKSNEHINKSCDLVLIAPQIDNNWKILIFDLKSDKPKVKDTNTQLLNSELFVRYLLLILKEHYNIEVNNPEFKKVVGTTKERYPDKSTSYRPNSNKKESMMNTPPQFKSVPIRVINENEGDVHLNELLE